MLINWGAIFGAACVLPGLISKIRSYGDYVQVEELNSGRIDNWADTDMPLINYTVSPIQHFEATKVVANYVDSLRKMGPE